MVKKRIAAWLPIVLAIFSGGSVFSQANVISSSKSVIAISENSGGYAVDFVLPAYSHKAISESTESYDVITGLELGYSSVVGQPRLPQVSFNIWIPNSTSAVSIQVLAKTETSENLDKKIYPVQQSWSKNLPISSRPFSMDRSYYTSSGSKYNVDYSISEPFVVAGVAGVTITLYPFKYSPQENVLTVIEKANLSITVQNGSKDEVLPVDRGSSFNGVYKSMFSNYSYLPFSSSDTKVLGGTGNYLIITDPSYSTTMSSFVTYRQSKGFTVNMFSTATTGTTTDLIKQFIQNRYNTMSTRPEFILLVGDVASIPAWTSTSTDNPWNDLYYGTLEGTDYFPDAHVGRFAVSSTTELTNIINKTINAGNNAQIIQPKKAVFLASVDNSSITEGTHNSVTEAYFYPKGYSCTKRYCVTYSATTDQVIADVNAGQTFCIYSGHGGQNVWADGPYFTQDNVRNLTNTQFPFVYSFSCLTGDYSVAECFGETWIRNSVGGASYWGSTVTSYWDEDDVLEKALIKAIFEDGINENCPSFNAAKIALYNFYSSNANNSSQRYFEQYNLLGDPALILHKKMINVSYLGAEKFKLVDGTVMIDGIEQTGTPSGLVFSMRAGITASGNLTRPQSFINQGTWLNTESNLTGGLVFRTNDNNEAHFHVSNTGAVRVRKTVVSF